MQVNSPDNPLSKIDPDSVGHELTREVYWVLGIPIDAVDMKTVLRKIEAAVANSVPFFLSTANLNFLIASKSDAEFRSSLLLSDLCTADGMPVVWVARLLGIPIQGRLAGADIFEALKSTKCSAPLKMFLFGGAEGVAATACKKLNSESIGVACVGSYYPGFGAVDEISSDVTIQLINSSNADFLAVALGAKKGQAWLLKNHDRIQVPVRAHLGATINFQAGAIRRAPQYAQKFGLEWLWRIKEEPELWRRYWSDGMVFLRLLLTQVLPLIAVTQWMRLRQSVHDLVIEQREDQKSVILSINGAATIQNIGTAATIFQEVAVGTKNIVINFSKTCVIDARFLGILSVLDKQLKKGHRKLTFKEVPRHVERIFRLSGFQLLDRD